MAQPAAERRHPCHPPSTEAEAGLAAPEHLQQASRNPREPPNGSKLQEVALSSAPPEPTPAFPALPSTLQAPSLAGRTEIEWKVH